MKPLYILLLLLFSISAESKTPCQFCIAGNKNFAEQIKTLSQLPPKDLLAKIEANNIKVLILSSGRKNPSKLFYWGQVRQDKGELNQISKIEGAMGKTLCTGERPESKEGPTIILASDSPYSTLVHEYVHSMQIKEDLSWCPVSKRLWTDKPTDAETRMVRDREWDVRLVLWDLLKSPQMNIEDQIIVTEGIIREAEARKNFDPTANKFLTDNNIQSYFLQKVEEYKKALTK